MSCSAALRFLVVAAIGLTLAAACGGGGSDDDSDPVDFAEFTQQIASAVESKDTAFFTGRIRGHPYVCTEEDVAASTGPDAPGGAICLEVGQQFEAVSITNYGAQGRITTPRALAGDFEAFFEDALPEESDNYGTGEVVFYATAVPVDAPEDTTLHTAIITAIHDLPDTGRVMRGIDFEFVEGRWVIPSEATAGFPISVDLLEPSLATVIYRDWEKYE